ncbi:uncharacterized protein LOC111369084 [Olea europaea var. sylvestris]|uniref:uncharacterized protein LOC111369084 n=1 Tax=Olea europaea var. sylvestris TaxID=158386 RepID=UPI000C1CDB32|nr:uncharacterized protein LOC111369084 [Olea europaea var. sylvestris]
MDFLFGLPRTQSGHDDIWIIVDRLTKTARFLPIKVTYLLDKLEKIYVDEIISLYGTSVSIVSLLNFGPVCRKLRVLNFISVQLFIYKQMFAYNNNYHSSIEMAHSEALYGRKCRTPVCWDEVGERKLLGREYVQITDAKVKYIPDPSHILESQRVELKENLTYEEEPVLTLDRKEHILRTKAIPLVKVLWRNHVIEEAI